MEGDERNNVCARRRDEGLEGKAESMYEGEGALCDAFQQKQLVERDHVRYV